MIKRLLTGGTLACVLAAGGCTKDQNEFIADPGTDTVWVSQVTSSDVVTRLADTVNTNAQLAVALPNQFTNANSAVFCWLKDYSSVVSLTGNYASRTFIANNLPVGESATIVALTLTGGLLYMGTKTVTLASGSQLVSVSSTIETLPSVLAYLEQL